MIERDVLIDEIARHVEDCVKGPDEERDRRSSGCGSRRGSRRRKSLLCPTSILLKRG
jgi:hypothetical protein